MKFKSLPSAEYLKIRLEYRPATGEFFWRDSGKKAGHEQIFHKGTYREHKRLMIRLDNELYLAARIAWRIMTGKDPEVEIDHRDTYPLNDRWSNLRLATRVENCRNTKRRTDNKSGFKGVSWDRFTNRWVARIRVYKGKYLNLGRFEDVDKAAEAYEAAAIKLFGEFARI